MSQLSFSDAEGQAKRKQTRREKFLAEMDKLLPWSEMATPISRYYSKSLTGRKPFPLSAMLRIHCMQLFYNLSDPAMEDILYEVESMRRFAGISIDTVPDETTILNFRHLLERHGLGQKLFRKINKHLEKKGLSFKEGTIVDATIISAPTSTKNQQGKRDPDMHQTRKGNEWHFGMKMHIGVDDALGVIHSIETTAANAHDITQTTRLLNGTERRVWGDAGYLGIEKRDEAQHLNLDWFIAARPGKRKTLNGAAAKLETLKASVRAKVEHPFRIIKQQFGYSKTRYRGLAKNTGRLYMLAGFANLIRCKQYLLT